MRWNTTQAKLKALDDNGVAECYYCERLVAVNPDQDIDTPMICDVCLEHDELFMPSPCDIGQWADMVC